MGIPLYFKTITEEYDNIVIDTKELKPVNRLFLDLNCAIHPCCGRVVTENYSRDKKDEYEQKMLNEIVNYIILLLDLVQPTQLLFIAIDGVAPRAKMEQQRLRRFKSIKEKSLINQIKRDLNEPYNEDNWDTNAITPGTQFIDKISKRLKYEIEKHESFKSRCVIFSDSSVPGEGEHKIFNYMRQNYLEGNDVVYGLDADLIMLSMASHKNNIYLLREALEFGKAYYESGYKFLYLDIDMLKECVSSEIVNKISINTPDSSSFSNQALFNFIDDYVVMCFILGNDFLPHLLATGLREKGLDLLLDKYIHTYLELGENLVDVADCKINTKFLRIFIMKISNDEDKILQKIFNFRKRFSLKNKNYESELDRRLDNLKNRPMFNKKNEIDIEIGSEGWRERYYKKCLGVSTQSEIDSICLNYIEGLKWTFNYYYNECISWQWFYIYRHGPSLFDLSNYLKSFDDINTIKMKRGVPNKPFKQLMCVLPPESNHLLPISYQHMVISNDSDLIEFYPIDYQFDMYYKRYFWQCAPILPILDDKKFKILSKLKLTKEEQDRNKLGKNLIYTPKIQII